MARARLHSFWLATASLLFGAAFAGSAHAAWSHDPISSGLQITPNVRSQVIVPDGPVADGSGGVFVPFMQINSIGGNDIIVQRLTATGAPAIGWPAGGVTLVSLSSSRNTARAVLDGSGGVIVCWIDHRSGTRDEIYAQRLNALGVPQWTSNGILASSLGTASKPQYSVCTDAAGGAFVAWRYDLSVADNDIFGTHVSSAGLATVFSVYTPTLIQTNPQICPDGAGGAYIAFEDNTSGAGVDVKMGHVNAANTLTFGPITMDGNAVGDQTQPTLLYDGASGVYIAWRDARFGPGETDIYVGHYDITGAPHIGFASDGYPTHLAADSKFTPAIALDATGGVYIFWNELIGVTTYLPRPMRWSVPG